VILFWLLRASTACQVSAIGEWIFLSLPAYTLRATIPSVTSHSPMRPPITLYSWIGILTDFPSVTPFGLSLGPDKPYIDEHRVGPLVSGRDLTLFSLSCCVTFNRPYLYR